MDLKNAFNCVSRQTVLEEVATHAPTLLPWALTAYGQEAALFFEGHELRSSAGVQQGDPLGPLFFAMALQRVLRTLPADLRLNSWYLDDGLLVLPASQVPAVFVQLIQGCAAIGLSVNPEKCLLWGPGLQPDSRGGGRLPGAPDSGCPAAAIPGMLFTPGSGTRVLGIPVEHPDSHTFRAAFLDERCQQMEAACDLVGQLGDPAAQLHLLRHCLDACKVSFLLRGMDTSSCSHQLARCRTTLQNTLGDIIGCGRVSDQQWTQASLPLRLGGLGIKDPMQTVAPARVAAILGFVESGSQMGLPACLLRPAPDLLPRLRDVVHWTGGDSEPAQSWRQGQTPRIEPDHVKQKWWAAAVADARRRALPELPKYIKGYSNLGRPGCK